MSLRRAAGAVAVFVGAGSVAGAQLTSAAPPVCSLSDAVGSIRCSGSWAGNVAPQQNSVRDQIVADWGSLFGLTTRGQVTYVGTTDAGSGAGPFQSFANVNSGTVTFDVAQTGPFVLALKGANAFSLYLFDGGTSGIGSITYSMVGVERNNPGLSNASLFTLQGTTVVPEPSTYALLATGLAGLAAVARRRRQV